MGDERSFASLPNVLKRLGVMTAIRDMQLVEQSLLRTLGPLLGVFSTSIYRVDEQQVVMRTLHYSRSIVTEQNGLERITEHVEEVRNDKNISEIVRCVFNDINLLDRACSRQDGNELVIGYPLHGGDELCGYFIFRREHEVTLVENTVVRSVLDVFSNYCALLDTSQRDRLTGLFNRYSLELNLDRLWSLLSARQANANTLGNRRETSPQTYWLGILDIDHFKTINDSCGHIIGDEVLLMVTRLLERAFRRSDLLYRYGGEEFIAVVAANDLETAHLAFERARIAIEQFPFPQIGHITISIGYCSADPNVLPQTIINRADRALYAAKNAGRNQTNHYDTLVNSGVLKEIPYGTVEFF